MERKTDSSIYFLGAFFISLIATAGSLFFSDVMNFIPCTLCWYQRIFMYPLVWIFLMAFIKNDLQVFKYSAPLSFGGFFFSCYHLLLYFEVIPQTVAPCSEHSSCTTTYIQWLGFITIPMLALTAFAAIGFLQFLAYRSHKHSQ